MTEQHLLIERFLSVKNQLTQYNQQFNQHTQLLAVSKTKPADDIRTLFNEGQTLFGENYLQEAIAKIKQLQDLPICWHYIGHIQRNKTRDIAQYFDWVQTIDRGIIAKRLNEQRPEHKSPLNVLIELNIDDEPSKSGCKLDELDGLIDEILGYSRLRLRGLMIIPNKNGSDAFARTQTIFNQLKEQKALKDWDTLSMGMSGDIKDAIMHGSTMVRIGTAIFGERNYQ